MCIRFFGTGSRVVSTYIQTNYLKFNKGQKQGKREQCDGECLGRGSVQLESQGRPAHVALELRPEGLGGGTREKLCEKSALSKSKANAKTLE